MWQSDETSSGEESVRHGGFYMQAEWGGIRRGLFVSLHEDGMIGTGLDSTGKGVLDDWEWPFEQSFFDPGAEWGFVTPLWLSNNCPSVQPAEMPVGLSESLQSYVIDITALYSCVQQGFAPWSDPVPSSAPVKGIHWFVEAAQASAELSAVMWMQVANPRIVEIPAGGFEF
jgi:hypothetical protein